MYLKRFTLPIEKEADLLCARAEHNGGSKYGYIDNPYPCGLFSDIGFGEAYFDNGRVGRVIMVKECLRHNIVLFIIDDKHRGSYNKGIQCWSSDKSVLSDICIKAQDRFKRQIEFQRLLQRTRNS